MGWNTLRIRRPAPLLEGVVESSSVYFVHSYHAVAARSTSPDVAAEADESRPVPGGRLA